MGTRHIIEVYDEDGIKRVAQYGEFDGYPAGQGADLIDFLSNENNIKSLKQHLKYVCFVPEDEIGELMRICSFNPFSRNHGARILYMISEMNPRYYNKFPLFDDSGFRKNYTCRWAYEINFKNNTFKIFKYEYGLVAKYDLSELPNKDDLKDLEKSLNGLNYLGGRIGVARGSKFNSYNDGETSEEFCAECGTVFTASLTVIPCRCPECGEKVVQCNACLDNIEGNPNCNSCEYFLLEGC